MSSGISKFLVNVMGVKQETVDDLKNLLLSDSSLNVDNKYNISASFADSNDIVTSDSRVRANPGFSSLQNISKNKR